jgi:predicted RNA binding protein YcfA (HicA-like mRNA interferase family)
MGKRKYLPLKPQEVAAIVLALGFVLKNNEGDHRQYERAADGIHPRSIVTVDMGAGEFEDFLMQSMIRQSNFTRDEFYGATKRTARKAGVRLFVPQVAG